MRASRSSMRFCSDREKSESTPISSKMPALSMCARTGISGISRSKNTRSSLFVFSAFSNALRSSSNSAPASSTFPGRTERYASSRSNKSGSRRPGSSTQAAIPASKSMCAEFTPAPANNRRISLPPKATWSAVLLNKSSNDFVFCSISFLVTRHAPVLSTHIHSSALTETHETTGAESACFKKSAENARGPLSLAASGSPKPSPACGDFAISPSFFTATCCDFAAAYNRETKLVKPSCSRYARAFSDDPIPPHAVSATENFTGTSSRIRAKSRDV